MTERQVKWIFGVLALLLVVYAGVRWLGDGERDAGRLGLAAGMEPPPEVVRIIGSDGDTILLDARRDTPRVNGFPADSAAMASFVAALDTAEADELVSRNPANHGRLGLSAEEADRVVIGPADTPTFSFLVGGSGRGGRFVRRPDADRAYLLEGPVVSGLDRTAGSWRDDEIAAVDTARVSRLVLERDGRRATLVREGGAWRTSGSGAVGASDASSILAELAGLRASSDAPPDSLVRAAGFGSPDALLRAWASADGEGDPLLELRAVRVGGDGGEYLVRRGDRPYTYMLPGYRADRVFPPGEE